MFFFFWVTLFMVINLKNKWWIILIFILIIALGFGIYFITKNKNSDNSYDANRISVSQEDANKTENNDDNKDEKNVINITRNASDNESPSVSEEVISTFSTKIYSSESSRQNNVNLTCSKLNGALVPNGSTFSFCDTLGPATYSDGFQKADVFDQNGNKEKGLGGGKCQVSTTLYNAVLTVPTLVVTERHPHSNKVPYIETGKDAAVSYGSYDLKFVNNCGFNIKIMAATDGNTITTSLLKVN